MDLRHAQTFVTVADLGTVSKAALRLHIAQPALSRQIAALEQEFGLKLFARIGRRLVLTGEGEQLLRECRALLNHAAAVSEVAQSLKGGDVGVLKVGASPQHIESVLTTFLPRYAQYYPNVQVKVLESAGLDGLRLLERGEIHLGQNLGNVVGLDDPRFARLPLGYVELLAASQPPLVLTEGRTVDISKLAPHPLLLLGPSFVFRRAFDAACRLAAIKPNIFVESNVPHTLLALAEGGYGVAIIPSQLRTRGYDLRIAAVTYRGKALREQMIILWDRQRPLPRYAHAYCEMLAAHVHEIFPITRPSRGPFSKGKLTEMRRRKSR
jgi:DNA-binding transcriptional LysR family regulator